MKVSDIDVVINYVIVVLMVVVVGFSLDVISVKLYGCLVKY